MAIAAISRSFGISRRTTRRPTGTIIAPPMPCRTRTATKTGRVVESAQSSEAKVKRTMAAQNTRRAPKRSAAQPLIGMKTPRVSM